MNSSLIVTCRNGFNSVLDLSNERDSKNTQKKLFSNSEWLELKEKYKTSIDWKPLPPQIIERLKIVENVSEILRCCSISQLAFFDL